MLVIVPAAPWLIRADTTFVILADSESNPVYEALSVTADILTQLATWDCS